MTDKAVFTSYVSGAPITAAQYLAEGICMRVARKEGKELHPGYWDKPRWKRTFLHQVRLANGLLQLYDAKAIIAGLKRAKHVLSLGLKMVLDPLFQEEQEKLDKQKEALENAPVPEPTPPPATPTKPREAYSPEQSLLGKLRSLD